MQHSPFPPLPCYPCPHQSACCKHGATLSPEEARAIRARHGSHLIYRNRWGEWRTRVLKGRCSFLTNNVHIYNRSYYPAVCRGFPGWMPKPASLRDTGDSSEPERRELPQINPCGQRLEPAPGPTCPAVFRTVRIPGERRRRPFAVPQYKRPERHDRRRDPNHWIGAHEMRTFTRGRSRRDETGPERRCPASESGSHQEWRDRVGSARIALQSSSSVSPA
jgi:hypothetical protein